MMTKDELKKKRKAQKDLYYSLSHELYNMKYKLQNLKGQRGHSLAFRQLILAIDAMEQQIRDDHSRYERRFRSISNGDVALELQQALNRERAKREELEKKIKEASESSGLFISYVRKKLNF